MASEIMEIGHQRMLKNGAILMTMPSGITLTLMMITMGFLTDGMLLELAVPSFMILILTPSATTKTQTPTTMGSQMCGMTCFGELGPLISITI